MAKPQTTARRRGLPEQHVGHVAGFLVALRFFIPGLPEDAARGRGRSNIADDLVEERHGRRDEREDRGRRRGVRAAHCIPFIGPLGALSVKNVPIFAHNRARAAAVSVHVVNHFLAPSRAGTTHRHAATWT